MEICTERWVLARLYEPDLTIIDCRQSHDYDDARIPGAVSVGMLDVNDLQASLGKVGITSTTRLVIYDDENENTSAKWYEILKNIEHEQVFVLSGGFKRWMNAKFPTETKAPIVRIPTFYKNF